MAYINVRYMGALCFDRSGQPVGQEHYGVLIYDDTGREELHDRWDTVEAAREEFSPENIGEALYETVFWDRLCEVDVVTVEFYHYDGFLKS